MKNLLMLMVLMTLGHFSFGNEVCWCQFDVLSQNKQFMATISPVDESIDNANWKNDWKIEIFKVDSGKKEEIIWESVYDYSGKPTGIVSNDGQYFTFVENWFYKEMPQVSIYKNGQKVASQIDGNSFKISKSKLKKTELHYLWLSEVDVPYEFKSTKNGVTSLIIRTVDGKEFEVNLGHGTFMSKK